MEGKNEEIGLIRSLSPANPVPHMVERNEREDVFLMSAQVKRVLVFPSTSCALKLNHLTKISSSHHGSGICAVWNGRSFHLVFRPPHPASTTMTGK